MADTGHREVQAAAWRGLAERARRLAGDLLDDPVKESLLKYAEELDERAAKLKADREERDEGEAAPDT